MALTDTGFTLERFSELVTQTDKEIQEVFEGGVDLSPDALIGVLYSLFLRGNAQLWELGQGVYDSIGLLSSEGVNLDNCALLVGHVRLPASHTRGLVNVTAKGGTVIPKGEEFISVLGDKFGATQEVIVTATNCLNTRMLVNTVSNNELYSMEVNNNQHTFISSDSATPSEILTMFQGLLAAEGDITTRFVPDLEDDSNSYLELVWTGTNTMALSASTFLNFDYLTSPVAVQAVLSGRVPANKETVNKLDKSGFDSVYSINNPENLIVGSDEETDFSLKQRVLASYGTVAGGTVDSIINGVAEVPDVISVKVVENTTYATVNNQPPKSFKTIVYGGTDADVALAIWENKPAGISAWADRNDSQRAVVKEIFDYNEQPHLIQFTRPEVQYVWVTVDYTRYPEEAFTSDGELIIQEVVASIGNLLQIGNDVIPKRFIGPIYKSVKGLSDVTVSVAITDDLNTTPLPIDYTEIRHAISDQQITNFAAARVIVNDIT